MWGFLNLIIRSTISDPFHVARTPLPLCPKARRNNRQWRLDQIRPIVWVKRLVSLHLSLLEARSTRNHWFTRWTTHSVASHSNVVLAVRCSPSRRSHFSRRFWDMIGQTWESRQCQDTEQDAQIYLRYIRRVQFSHCRNWRIGNKRSTNGVHIDCV